MTALFWTEKAVGQPTTTSLLTRATDAKKLVLIAGAAATEVEFRDGWVSTASTGTLIARLRAPANTMVVLPCETNERFRFATSVFVTITTGAGVVGIYTMGNPSPSFA